MKKSIVLLAMLMAGAVLWAGDDPSIKNPLRAQIQKSMMSFILAKQVNGTMPHYDPVVGKLLKLRFKKLHSGIVKKGDYYVSCADFVDQMGQKVDIDFLVWAEGDNVKTLQALVHKVAKKKRPYHLEDH